jgi:hypothetical protein
LNATLGMSRISDAPARVLLEECSPDAAPVTNTSLPMSSLADAPARVQLEECLAHEAPVTNTSLPMSSFADAPAAPVRLAECLPHEAPVTNTSLPMSRLSDAPAPAPVRLAECSPHEAPAPSNTSLGMSRLSDAPAPATAPVRLPQTTRPGRVDADSQRLTSEPEFDPATQSRFDRSTPFTRAAAFAQPNSGYTRWDFLKGAWDTASTVATFTGKLVAGTVGLIYVGGGVIYE